MDEATSTADRSSALRESLVLIRSLKSRLEALERKREQPIAIIGAGCRFPEADSPEEFWRLLHDGRDAVREVPSDRWDARAFDGGDDDGRGKTNIRHGAFLRQVDRFDPLFFGISPREAGHMDPQQRLLLEVSWEALESSGQSAARLAGSRTGTYLGVGHSDYGDLQLLHGDALHVDGYHGTGSGSCYASGRVSYLLGLQGPNMSLDTSCSSSLVAVHLACQGLRGGECDLALAGGVQLVLTPVGNIVLSRAQALSPDGRCYTFDARANGYVRGEGCGIVVLKRLADAAADGDHVLAVIRGSAINHDGRSSGFTVPNGLAQQAVIEQALYSAGIPPSRVGYVEAHGTGTALGDPIELEALGAVFGDHRDPPLVVGSVKTNVGHLETAAGIAGLIKVVLSLQHGEIPPT